METDSSDDDDDDSVFDTVLVLCQDAFSDSSTSDGEDEEEERALFVWGGSTQGRASNIERNEAGLLIDDSTTTKECDTTFEHVENT